MRMTPDLARVLVEHHRDKVEHHRDKAGPRRHEAVHAGTVLPRRRRNRLLARLVQRARVRVPTG